MTTTDKHPIVSAVRPWVVPIDPATPILDFQKSQGAYMYDAAVGKLILDFASHYASLPLGYNHPAFSDPEYEAALLETAKIKIANLDVLTPYYQKFLETFIRVVGPKDFVKYFFVEGGALAVENAMKIAFDWKIHRNMHHGKGERGTKILHFREAFHGRSGYTLSVTNTADPNKIKYFPKFDWPRVQNPKMRFPMEGENLHATLEDERAAMREIQSVLAEQADDIAAILIEPIQGEGGDNHFRLEFLQFLRNMANEHDCLLIFDEVQTGMGMTGSAWAFQTIGVTPDIVAFAKKAQMGGCIVGPRVMQEPKNCFTVPSRISSTWGGSLTDMVRCTKYLEIVEEENLFQNAKDRGAEIVAGLHEIAERTELIYNVRGSGLFIAFDLVHPELRGQIVDLMYDKGLMVLVCGHSSIRFRPHLNVTSDVVQEALKITEECVAAVTPSMPRAL
jgi:L-lysine 6-transaminase